MNHPDKAIDAFSKALQHDAKYVPAYMGRAVVYSAKKDHDRALAEFNAVLRLNPNDPFNLCNRAKIYIDKKEYDKAIADYTEALRIAPRFDHAYFSRAIAWLHKREYAKVLDDCDEAVTLNPKNALAYNQRAWILATCPNEKVRDGKRAVESAKRAVALAQEAGMMDTLAAAYAEAGDFESAISWEERALQDANFRTNDGAGARQRLALYRRQMPYRDQPAQDRVK
jgi:tetratricopeptide (TPR) repeat protein